MNARVRVLKTFGKLPGKVDRVPVQFEMCRQLTDHEMGFEVFNPVQPDVPGHLPKDMKDGFGDRFSFWGAVDQQDLLPNGTDEELEKDITEKISILGAGGGYMISPAHIIQNDVTPERVLKFIELCKKHGKIE